MARGSNPLGGGRYDPPPPQPRGSGLSHSGYGNRIPRIDPVVASAVANVYNRTRLSHKGWKTRELHGRLVARDLHRFKAKQEVDLFRNRKMPAPTAMNVHLLVDASGSMYGRNAMNAQDVCGTLVHAFKRINAVRVNVWQHNAMSDVNLYKVYAYGGANKLDQMLNNVGGGNADHFALRAVGEIAAKDARPDEVNLVIVISDGLPSVGALDASNHDLVAATNRVITSLRKQGVYVMSVAIAPAISAKNSDMYGADNVVPFTGDYGDLARSFGAVFGSLLSRIGDDRAR